MPFSDLTLNDGHKIPQIAFGTGSALYEKDAADAVEQALNNGFDHIDTAQVYHNEESVGAALRDSGVSRSEVFITTKYGGGNIREELEKSLTKLGVTYVDLYLIHFPASVEKDFAGSWEEFEKIKKDGLAKSIGVSNFTVDHLKKILETANIVPAVNQIRYNPYNHAEHASLLRFAAEKGIIIEAYGSLAPITKKPGGPVDVPVAQAAARLGATPAQVIFSWVKAKGAVIVTTTSKKERLQEYLGVGDLPPLTQEEIEAIDAAGLVPWHNKTVNLCGLDVPRSVLLTVILFLFVIASSRLRCY
ncbi:hypothetical protein BOTBODRAFT_28493 [Botryobasidium botryosum FD-172 SS1]|uniref:NADP-dependent oxidoreductase domain-containing protein n=1 Tax=Botryobasidium botryosum (strain FD-172 SS1) TaxID=930990 RepID=A0A067MTT4_BOTB1|nr:hypothetical protein BOTBODRAFT_28493 [Botryobasidium botryosum FD-172 SS1]